MTLKPTQKIFNKKTNKFFSSDFGIQFSNLLIATCIYLSILFWTLNRLKKKYKEIQMSAVLYRQVVNVNGFLHAHLERNGNMLLIKILRLVKKMQELSFS